VLLLGREPPSSSARRRLEAASALFRTWNATRASHVTLEFTIETLTHLKNIARRQLHTLYELEDDEFKRREVWLHDPDGYLVVLSEEPSPPA
jgi:hypothetical protein